MDYFDYLPAANAAGLSAEQLHRVEAMVRRDYPNDRLQFELHVLRVCHALRDGRLSLDRLLAESVRPLATASSGT